MQDDQSIQPFTSTMPERRHQMSRLILISVPGSTGDGDPVVRVVVVPKLDAAESAAAGMADWPAVVAGATFRAELSSGTTFDLSPTHDGDVNVWNAFFGALRVDAPAPPDMGPEPQVRATSVEVEVVNRTYSVAALVDVAADDAEQANLGTAAARQLRENWTGGELPPIPPQSIPPVRPDADFHQVLAMLREHPIVLRRLGLVFDLRLPEGAELEDSGTVRVLWPDPPAGLPEVVSPRSTYDIDPDRGLVPGRTTTTRAGVVNLADTAAWGTSTLDVDNAVHRLRDAAASLGSDAHDGAVRLPALRSAGIQLLRKTRAVDFANRRDAAIANSGLAEDAVEEAVPLTADDLTLGIRIDVRPKTSLRWTSLMRREAEYRVNGELVLPKAEEEGHLKPGATVRHRDTLQADEIVARWNGWSLGVPHTKPSRENRQALPFEFEWDFQVPDRSLIPLRFGHDYHLRARIADIAGGGVGREDRDIDAGTGPIPYVRHDPIGSPTVTLPDGIVDLGPGGSLDHLVIRSDAADYPRNDVRILTAPHATLDVAEQHGMLDGRDEETFQRVQRALGPGLPDPASAGVTAFLVPQPGGHPAATLLLPWSTSWPDAPPKTVRLEIRPTGDDDVLDPDREEDLFVVRLGPAEEVTLALSSFLRGDFLDHLALQQRRTTALPNQVVKDGRHPMATPAVSMTFVHAVRRPRAEPAGSFTAVQQPGDLAAILIPQPSRLEVNTASTMQLQVSASWDEFDDDEQPTRMSGVAVQNIPIARGDTELRDQIIHEFGDTKHRSVTYTLTAVSRFRHLYKPQEDPKLFVTTGETEPVSIKSTARPAPPMVRSVVPAFHWTNTEEGGVVKHVRSGGTLRVELSRPWYVTGAGEQLAVIADRSVAGRDPIWQTPEPRRLLAQQDFTGGDAATVNLPDGAQVQVVAYDTKFADGRWVADVELAGVAASSYRPFVRLDVARYQRESLENLEISSPVTCDLVQLMPERTLTVDTSQPGRIMVKLDGPGPGGPNKNRYAVISETLEAPSATDVSRLEGPEELPVWSGEIAHFVNLGETIEVQRFAGTTRIRVREVEMFGFGPEASSMKELNERVVFSDIVDIPRHA